jgi:transcriptional regulatory protein RtcR
MWTDRRAASTAKAHSDFQLIAGTNQDLFAAVREGRFREDLLARINLWTFSLPGLRSRPEDIARPSPDGRYLAYSQRSFDQNGAMLENY